MAETDVEIRAARVDEADEVLGVLCAAFGLSLEAARPIFYADPFFNLSHKRILRTPQHGIVSCLTLVPGKIRIGASWVSIAGIAGVATLPEHQGQGWAARLLRETLPIMAEELGCPLAGLFAVSDSLYRRLGWAAAAHSPRQWLLPAEQLYSAQASHVRPLNGQWSDDAAALRRLHTAWAEGRTGGSARDERRWQLIFAAAGRSTVLYDDPAQGVLGYAIFDQAGSRVCVREAVGIAAEALSRADAEAAPPEPPLMLRVTDVLGALRALYEADLQPRLAAAGRSLTVCVQDNDCVANQRPVRLTPSHVTPGRADDPERLSLGVGAFAQILMGFRLPSDAAGAGEASADSLASLALADALFLLRAPSVAPLDYF